MPVYLVDKPLGLTSHDVVARARRLLGTRAVGHAGTLDPLATGVLVVLSGEATKLSPFLTASEKRYLAWVSFGAGTPTLDAEGPVSETGDTAALTAELIRSALPPFLALTEQLPPQYSAVKKGGVKGYEAARKGEVLELSARPAGYDRLELLGFAPSRAELGAPPLSHPAPLPPTLGSYPTALFDLSVQAGTYVRAFARDLGAALGVPAHLAGLVRTASGRFGLEQAVALETLPTAAGLPLADALPYPLLGLSTAQVTRVRQGQRLEAEGLADGRLGLVDAARTLIAVAEIQDGRMKLLRVWPETAR
jgi:tRNA pseudouridine55 synthase